MLPIAAKTPRLRSTANEVQFMRICSKLASIILTLGAFGALCCSAEAMLTGGTSGVIQKAGDSVKLGSAGCGHNILVESTATVEYQYWSTTSRGENVVENDNIWTGSGEKAVTAFKCIEGTHGYILAVGKSGKFPATAQSVDQTGGGTPAGTGFHSGDDKFHG